MKPCQQAVILAAGLGSRLGGLTTERPKCLVPVLGRPLIEPLIADLARLGIQEIVFVVGHLADVIKAQFGESQHGVPVKYVMANDYASTNNIVSLWVARDVIKAPFLLLESDLVLPLPALASVLTPDAMAVAPFTSAMNGTIVDVDATGLTTKLILKRDQTDELDRTTFFKTVNAYSFSKETWESSLQPSIARYIEAGKTNDYYEAAFGDEINAGRANIRSVDISETQWIEIDTPEDLALAEAMFSA